VHGECASIPSLDSGMQYLTDGRRKYIWYPGNGTEHYFDLENDPREMHELSTVPARADEIAVWRRRLVERLTGRPEGFTDGMRLTPIGDLGPARTLKAAVK
jgi:hypothetical protein